MTTRAQALAIALAALWIQGCRGGAPDVEAHSRSGIISLVPAATEILFAIGAGGEVVGVSDFCEHPAGARSLPRFGGFLDPSTETILASSAASIVLDVSSRDLAAACRDSGIEVVQVANDDIEDMDNTIAAMGRLARREREAEDLRKRIHGEIAAAAKITGASAQARIAVVVDRSPDALTRLFVAGPHSIIDDLLDALHATNVFADTARPYPMVSLESIVSRSPGIVIDMRPLARGPAGGREAALGLWMASGILAPGGPVGAVHVLEAADFTVPGPRLGRAAAALAAVIRGEASP